MCKFQTRLRILLLAFFCGSGVFATTGYSQDVWSEYVAAPPQQTASPQQHGTADRNADRGVLVAHLPGTSLTKSYYPPHPEVTPQLAESVETVYVPDREAFGYTRVEYGTPVLNKVPYINRLFMNTAIGRELPWMHNSWNETYALAGSGRFLLQVHEDGKVDFWDLSGRGWHRPKLVDTCFDPKIHVDIASTNIWFMMPGYLGPWVRLVPGDETFWHCVDKTATLRSVQDGTVLRTIATEPQRRFLAASALSPDGTLLVIQEGDDVKFPEKVESAVELIQHSDNFRPGRPALVFFDTASGLRRQEISLPDGCVLSMLRFSPDGKTLLAACGNSGTTYRFDVATGTLAGKFEMPGKVGVQAVDFSADGTKILTSVSFCDEEYHVSGLSVAMGSTAKYQVTVRQGGEEKNRPLYRSVIHVWDARTFEMLHQIAEPGFVVGRAAFSRDGNRILLHGIEIKTVESRSFLGLKKDYGISEIYGLLVAWNLTPNLPEPASSESTSDETTPRRRTVVSSGVAPGEFVFDADWQRLLGGAGISFLF